MTYQQLSFPLITIGKLNLKKLNKRNEITVTKSLIMPLSIHLWVHWSDMKQFGPVVSFCATPTNRQIDRC